MFKVVTNSAELLLAMKAAVGGACIFLAPGTYSNLTAKIAPIHDIPINIISENPANWAVLTNFDMTNARGLRFINIEFLCLPPAPVPPPSVPANLDNIVAFKWAKSSDIHIERSRMHGSLDANADNDVCGFSFRWCDEVSVIGTEFQQLGRVGGFGQTTRITFRANYVHDVRSDGLNFNEVRDVLVKDNSFRGFKPQTGDHPDAIQFWTTASKTNSRNIVVEGNLIFKGDGVYTQGIFFRDQVGTFPFLNTAIRDNLIVGTGWNGIRIQGSRSIFIEENELITFAGENNTYILVQNTDGVYSAHNKATQISYDKSTDVTALENVISKPVTDRGAAAIKAFWARRPDVPKFAL